MAIYSDVTRGSVLQAIRECDEKGRESFLREHGYGRSKAYILAFEGREYDSKAILLVACMYEHGLQDSLPHNAFSGGKATVVAHLRHLGFEVTRRADATKLQARTREGKQQMLSASDVDIHTVHQELSSRGIEAAFLVPTQTGLRKSLMDANEPLRAYFRESSFHDYDDQQLGQKNKRLVPCFFVQPMGLVETRASLYRPKTKKGDPRIWFSRLGDYAQAGNLLAVIVHEASLYVANCSDKSILASVGLPGSPTAFLSSIPNMNQTPTDAANGSELDNAGHPDMQNLENTPRNATVTWLLGRQFAQSGGVAVPGETVTTHQAPALGDFPAAVSEALDAVFTHLTAAGGSSDIDAHWCFLLGGPGNGKSEAMRVLLGRLGLAVPIDPEFPERVPRTIPPSWPAEPLTIGDAKALVLINDASIPRHDAPDPMCSLLEDIGDAVSISTASQPRPLTLIANINRGVLVREVNAASRTEQASELKKQALHLLKWLASGGGHHMEVDQDLGEASAYYRSRDQLWSGDTDFRVRVHAVYLDALSLLEPRPPLDIRDGHLEPTPYRPLGGFAHDQERSRSEKTPVGRLLADIVDPKRWEQGDCRNQTGELCPAADHCPFLANAAWLAERSLRDNFLDLLRAGEISTGHRLTYREVLAGIARSVLGPARLPWYSLGLSTALQHPCDWVRTTLAGLDQPERARAEAIGRLLSHRIYVSLFPRLVATKNGSSSPPAVADAPFYSTIRAEALDRDDAFLDLLGTSRLDPAADLETWDGLRRRALDAVQSAGERPPSEDSDLWSSLPAEVANKLDNSIDELLLPDIASQEKGGKSTNKKRAALLRKWRSQLLLRQLGLAHGWFPHRKTVSLWLDAQRRATLGGTADVALERGLRQLVFPKRGNTNQVTFSPYRPRTYALDELTPSDVFITTHADDFSVRVRSAGDHLLAELAIAGDPIGLLVVDLSVAREANIRVDGSQHSFTEVDDSAFSKIERARAMLVASLSRRPGGILVSNKTGDVFELRVDRTYSAPVRVEAQEGIQ